MALYRSGRFEEALQALTKAAERGFSEEQPTEFVIAMTLHRLGRRADARSSYDRAVKALWFPNNPEMLFFKAEAARTLGIVH